MDTTTTRARRRAAEKRRAAAKRIEDQLMRPVPDRIPDEIGPIDHEAVRKESEQYGRLASLEWARERRMMIDFPEEEPYDEPDIKERCIAWDAEPARKRRRRKALLGLRLGAVCTAAAAACGALLWNAAHSE